MLVNPPVWRALKKCLCMNSNNIYLHNCLGITKVLIFFVLCIYSLPKWHNKKQTGVTLQQLFIYLNCSTFFTIKMFLFYNWMLVYVWKHESQNDQYSHATSWELMSFCYEWEKLVSTCELSKLVLRCLHSMLVFLCILNVKNLLTK